MTSRGRRGRRGLRSRPCHYARPRVDVLLVWLFYSGQKLGVSQSPEMVAMTARWSTMYPSSIRPSRFAMIAGITEAPSRLSSESGLATSGVKQLARHPALARNSRDRLAPFKPRDKIDLELRGKDPWRCVRHASPLGSHVTLLPVSQFRGRVWGGTSDSLLFMVTPPEKTVERAWKRGLRSDGSKSVSDLLLTTSKPTLASPAFSWRGCLIRGTLFISNFWITMCQQAHSLVQSRLV